DPDRTVLPAAIIPPLLVPGAVHAIGDPRSVGGDLALITARQPQRLFDACRVAAAAVERHGPEARGRARRIARARGGEQDRRAVRRPALHELGTRVPRQPRRLTAVRRDDVDIDVAGVLAAEGNPLSVWREMRIRRLTLEARQPARDASRALDAPDVVRV